MDTRELPCADCGVTVSFVQPPCADGHGPDCPEWVCVDCGTAVLIAPLRAELRSLTGPAGASHAAVPVRWRPPRPRRPQAGTHAGPSRPGRAVRPPAQPVAAPGEAGRPVAS